MTGTPPAGREIGAERRAWHTWVTANGQWKRAIQGYLAGISFADAMIGRILEALERSPYAKNTIVVLWSDNGFHLGERETWEKFTLWEESTRIALMISAPGVTRSGGICRRPVSLLDIYPTLVELSGGKPAPALEGTSLVPLLRNPAAPSDRAVVSTWLQHQAVRSERWRYIRYGDGSEELYDHETDPDEFVNLAGKADLAGAKRELALWLPEYKIPVPKGAR
jgi:arylsulfatase A-like enzyme